MSFHFLGYIKEVLSELPDFTSLNVPIVEHRLLIQRLVHGFSVLAPRSPVADETDVELPTHPTPDQHMVTALARHRNLQSNHGHLRPVRVILGSLVEQVLCDLLRVENKKARAQDLKINKVPWYNQHTCERDIKRM